MQFILQLSNHVFQIALPMHVEDRKQLEAGKFTTALWPNTWADVEHQARYGRTSHKDYDMSGVEVVRGDSTSMVLSYDRLVDMPGTVAQPDDEPKNN
jgi:hypothetical protein